MKTALLGLPVLPASIIAEAMNLQSKIKVLQNTAPLNWQQTRSNEVYNFFQKVMRTPTFAELTEEFLMQCFAKAGLKPVIEFTVNKKPGDPTVTVKTARLKLSFSGSNLTASDMVMA